MYKYNLTNKVMKYYVLFQIWDPRRGLGSSPKILSPWTLLAKALMLAAMSVLFSDSRPT